MSSTMHQRPRETKRWRKTGGGETKEGAREIKEKELDMRARRLLECVNENISEWDLCWEKGIKANGGRKEAVTKECKNKDCCVGERERNRKENMMMESKGSVVAANILMKLLC